MPWYHAAGCLPQIEKRKALSDKNEGFFSFIKTDTEYIRWYDREDHTIFDVCADDHCQRYQGITKASSAAVTEAVRATRGQLLMYERGILRCPFLQMLRRSKRGIRILLGRQELSLLVYNP